MTRRLSNAILASFFFAVSAPAQTITDKKTTPLSPAVEEALQKFRDDSVDEKVKQLTTHMKAVMDAIHESGKLSAEETKVLEEKAKPLVLAAVETWKPRYVESLRGWVASSSEKQALAIIKQWRPQQAVNEPVENWTLPSDLPEWTDAVKATLGAERFAAWEKVLSKKTKERDDKIADYLTKWAEKGRKPMDDELSEETEAMTTALKLDEPKVSALKEAKKKIVDAITAKELDRATKMFRNMTEPTRKDMMGRNYYYVAFGSVGFDHVNRSTLRPDWTAAVWELLGEEQTKVWTAWKEEKNKRDKQELAKDVKALGALYREQFVTRLSNEAKRTATMLSLPEDRSKSLQKAAEEASDAFVNEWSEKMTDALLKHPAAFRQEVLNRRAGIQVDVPGEDDPRQVPAWIKAKQTLLKPEELAKLKAVGQELARRTAASHAMLIVSELDRNVGFTAEQREKIEPLLARHLVSKTEKSTSEDENGDEENGSLDLRSLINEGAKLKEKDIKPLLLEPQWKRWQTEVKREPGPRRRPAVGDAKPKDKKQEPLSVEAILSEHLHNLQEAERENRFAAMRVRVEEAARIGSLSPAAAARLQSAAQGAVESSLVSWMESMANWMRNSLRNATPQSVKAQLEGMGTLYNRSDAPPEQSALWKGTIEEVLKPEAITLWKKEQEDREAYRNRALARTVLAEVNRRNPIRDEQADKLEPLLAKITKEYGQDLNDWYSEPWYGYSYVLCTPLAGVPEKDMAEIFTPEELKHLKSSVLEQAAQNWAGVHEQHESRVGRGKN
jgi:hypothetical protein